jgi:transcriptional regulator with XRE-family HTH domain
MSENSFEFDLDPKSREFVRLAAMIHREIDRAVSEECKKHRLTKADVARCLGVDKGNLTRRLNGTSNLTIRSIAELCWALNQTPEFRMVSNDKVRSVASNHGENISPISTIRFADQGDQMNTNTNSNIGIPVYGK